MGNENRVCGGEGGGERVQAPPSLNDSLHRNTEEVGTIHAGWIPPTGLIFIQRLLL